MSKCLDCMDWEVLERHKGTEGPSRVTGQEKEVKEKYPAQNISEMLFFKCPSMYKAKI